MKNYQDEKQNKEPQECTYLVRPMDLVYLAVATPGIEHSAALLELIAEAASGKSSNERSTEGIQYFIARKREPAGEC